MATIPVNPITTAEKLKQWYQSETGVGNSQPLGASEIAHSCERYLWYGFRHADEKKVSQKSISSFSQSLRQETELKTGLQSIGVQVVEKDQSGKVYRFQSETNPFFSDQMQGAVLGLPEAEKTWHVYQTVLLNQNKFENVEKLGLAAAKPNTHDRIQMLMHWSKMTRGLFIAVNKNDDSFYVERIKYNSKLCVALEERAERVVFSPTPLEKINHSIDYYECRLCSRNSMCHGNALPAVVCRTCCHSTPQDSGDWLCEKHGHILTEQDQKQACDDHLFIPELVPATMIQGDTGDGWIQYQKQDGTTFVNCKADHSEAYSSYEIAANFNAMGDEGVEMIRGEMGMKVAG